MYIYKNTYIKLENLYTYIYSGESHCRHLINMTLCRFTCLHKHKHKGDSLQVPPGQLWKPDILMYNR